MAALRDDPRAELMVIVSGTHLSPAFGLTVAEVKADFPLAAEVDMLVDGDSNWATSTAAGLGTVVFANTFRQLRPDILLVLGDRFEILSAVFAAFLARMPIAHIHGGEVTEGALDDGLRHAITKLSRLHFVSNTDHGRRVVQLGEDPQWVHVVGAPGLESFARIPCEERSEFEKRSGVRLGNPTFLFTYHPATAVDEPVDAGMDEIIAAFQRFPAARIVATGSNADPGGRRVMQLLRDAQDRFGGRLTVTDSLGQHNYINALRLCDVVVGNSSSGIIEAPSAGTPTVNLGRRQEGRPRASSVLDCPLQRDAIVAGIERALSHELRRVAAEKTNPYAIAGLDISGKITQILLHTQLNMLHEPKTFHDILLPRHPETLR